MTRAHRGPRHPRGRTFLAELPGVPPRRFAFVAMAPALPSHRPAILDRENFVELLTAARAGDHDALEALVEAYYPPVQRMVHKHLARDLHSHRPWLASRFSTGDVVQEVFRSVLKDLGAFAGQTEGAFLGYLSMVVRNRIVDAIRFHESEKRDGRRTDPTTGTWLPDASDGRPEDRAVDAEESERMHRALSELPERERLLVRARLEGLETFEELTEQLGFGSVSATQRAFYAARARLTLALKQD